jgi:hypothetical protein
MEPIAKFVTGLTLAGVLIFGMSIDHRPIATASQSEPAMSREKLDAIIKAKAVAGSFGLTAQQYYAYELAAEKAGISPRDWYYTMQEFMRKMSEIRSGGPLNNRLYSMGAGNYVSWMQELNTWQALEQSIVAIRRLKAPAAQNFSNDIGLGAAGIAINPADVTAALPSFAYLTDKYFAQAKKARDAMIDAGRR